MPRTDPSGRTTLTTVLLPAPFSPTRPWISPGSNSKETSSSAWVAPNLFDTPDSEAGAVRDAAAFGALLVIVAVGWLSLI